MAITRTKERIRTTGEIFTPTVLVDDMLDKLPLECFTDPSKTFCDPAAGDGNFLIRVVQKKIEHGSTPTQALETTYGVELMEDNAERCRQRLLMVTGDTDVHRNIVEQNIVCANALTEWDFENWCRL